MRIADDGYPFILPPVFLATLAVATGQLTAAALMATAGVGIALFFRDPERCSDAPPAAVTSPADGRVVELQRLADDSLHFAIFLSIFDVHVARSPATGLLTRCDRVAGGYAAAFSEAARDNARVAIDIDTPHGRVSLALMAGLVARRVLPWISAPATLHRGDRIAIIRFGSRAELVLPPGFEPLVGSGATVRAGRTAIARYPS